MLWPFHLGFGTVFIRRSVFYLFACNDLATKELRLELWNN